MGAKVRGAIVGSVGFILQKRNAFGEDNKSISLTDIMNEGAVVYSYSFTVGIGH